MNFKLLKKAKEKHFQAEKLFFSDDDIRWATPQIVADYRAKKLKCKVIADLGCGIGFQTFAFAKTCKKVYALEINERKIELAKKNASVLGLKNIEFILGDVLDQKIIDQIKDTEIVFCDPERLAGEEKRTIETIQPNIQNLLKLYSKITDKIALELPPQIRQINFNTSLLYEKEYLSLNGNLNRLNIYFGSLKKSKFSSVVLPENKILSGDGTKKIKPIGKLLNYFYEVNPAVVKAGLVGELAEKTETFLAFESKSCYLTSDNLVDLPFFKNSYKIVEICNFDQEKIIKILEKNGAGKVVIRFEVDPKDYWTVRNSYERCLRGTKTFYLFKFGNLGFIASDTKQFVCLIHN